MTVGPFPRRELITAVRRGAAFSDRCGVIVLMTVIVAVSVLVWDWRGWDRTSVDGAASFALSTFAWVVASQAALAIGFIPSLVAPVIASERDRRSLDSLLATRLSATEIILGALAARLLRYGNAMTAFLPVFTLFVILGGIDPRLVLLAAAGLVSTSTALASLAVAVSATARTTSRAMTYSVGLAMAWMCMPQLIVMLLPRLWPVAASWVTPVALWALDSSPAAVALSLAGVLGRGPLLITVPRMIGLQMIASVGLVLWAIFRLRPASRAAHDVGSRLASIRFFQARWRPRPPCGDDPVLWHELHSGRCTSGAALWGSRLFHATWIGLLAYGISWFALPAFAELHQYGYGPSEATPKPPEVNPIARVLVGKLMRLSAGPSPGDARPEFNYVLRTLTSLIDALYVLMVVGAAAESVASERDRDTWLGLIATPLSGREILRAKMLGSIWRARGLALLMLGLCAFGLMSGAVHPIGFLAALISLGSSSWFLAALGVAVSLRSRDRAQATSRLIAPLVLILVLSGLPFFVPGKTSVILAGFTMPFQLWASLLSYEDIQAATHSGVIVQFASIGLRDGDGLRMILATLLIGMMAQAAGAFLLMGSAVRGFDAEVGRPTRTQGGSRHP